MTQHRTRGRRETLTPERARDAIGRLAFHAGSDHPVLREVATAKLRELLEEVGGAVEVVTSEKLEPIAYLPTHRDGPFRYDAGRVYLLEEAARSNAWSLRDLEEADGE